jgi:hypothetical protein
MRLLTDDQWGDLLSSCRQSAFHLETRDTYDADDERERFHAFLATGQRDHEADYPQRRPWLESIRRVAAAGVRVRRTRIVSEPVSDYIRFEYHGAAPTIESGEDLRWLPRRLAYGIAVPVNDFWILDGQRVVFNNFDGNGRPLGQVVTDDPAIAELCRDSFDAAWKAAIPHDEYTL